MYRLFTIEKKQIVCSTEYSRAVGDTKYVFRAHPNYKSKGAWYDWMVLNYLTEDDTLTSHIARSVTVVHDPEITGNFVPVIQWTGTLTGKSSVLMTEYHISQSFMDFDALSFSIFDPDSILSNALVYVVQEATNYTASHICEVNQWPSKFCDIE